MGAHRVGAPDGAASGLPVTGWRSDVGDLRVGHFVGLHTLQVLPMVGAVLLRRRLRERQRVGLVHVTEAGYLGLTLLVTWQALRAQALLSLDVVTRAALGCLVLGCVLVGSVVVWRGRGAADAAHESAPDSAPAGASMSARRWPRFSTPTSCSSPRSGC